MVGSLLKPLISPEEYLAEERRADFKSEYIAGQIYAMAGGSPAHNTIAMNLSGEVYAQLKRTPCQAFSSDMKVRTNSNSLYSYPDLTVVCGEPTYHDNQGDVLTNPLVIFEVLSPSTERFDRGAKFAHYQQIASLTDYVLSTQDTPRIEHYARQSDSQWLLTVVEGRDATLQIESIACSLVLADIYDRLTFPVGESGR